MRARLETLPHSSLGDDGERCSLCIARMTTTGSQHRKPIRSPPPLFSRGREEREPLNMSDELRGKDQSMMVRPDTVDQLERVSIVTDDLNQTSAEELAIAAIQIALIFSERLTLIGWEIMVKASALLRVGRLFLVEHPTELRARIDARLYLGFFASLR
tara:strand:+ start:906 stop:1379 length:474 start_codon:yes stop_codon:yes gene_type:complete